MKRGRDMKKRIGITCSEELQNDKYVHFINHDYLHGMIEAGAVPVLLPPIPVEDIEMQIESIDGLMVIGGCDVNPLVYNQEPQPLLGETDYPRDLYEIALIKACAQKKLPIFGVCRGLQVINVAFGGTLYQDLSYAPQKTFLHSQKERKECASHTMKVEKDSFLYPIFQEKGYVNSFHHQAINQLGENLRAVAWSDDQIIEAIEHTFLPVTAVQFHPEGMCATDKKMQEIFNQFIRQC